jgi:hypothetical protein
MGRPKEAIRAQLISGTDRYRVIFAEHPEWYFNTRFIDSEVAKQWAKKNKELLFAERQKETLSFRALGENFFKPGSPGGQTRSRPELSGLTRCIRSITGCLLNTSSRLSGRRMPLPSSERDKGCYQ